MDRKKVFIILGIIFLVISGGLYYFTITPIERTITTEEYVTKEKVVTKERTVPKETLVKKTREVVVYRDVLIADLYKDFEPNEYLVIRDITLNSNDRIKYIITTDPSIPSTERLFQFLILDNQNYGLWRENQNYSAYYESPLGEINLSGIWTVPVTGIKDFKLILSNKNSIYPKRIYYTITKQEATYRTEEYTQKVTQNVTETYQVKEPYQELETVTKTEEVLYDEYRPVSYIVGIAGILALIMGLVIAHNESTKRIQEFRNMIAAKYRPKDIPRCPNCGSKVIDTHRSEDGVELYKCTFCHHLFDMK